MSCFSGKEDEIINYYEDGDKRPQELMSDSNTKQYLRTWSTRIAAIIIIEIGLINALILWISWLKIIPLVDELGDKTLATLALATLTNIIICLVSVGVQYAIWRYYASVVLLIIAAIIVFFTFVFKW